MLKERGDVFLTAKWENLIHITYKIKKDKLFSLLPSNVELDLYGGDSLVSLVAFNFKNTAVKGIPIPFYGNFPEINLRFYVKDNNKNYNGVVFIREIIPRAGIALLANTLYKEHYVTLPIKNEVKEISDTIRVFHSIYHNNRDHSIEIISKNRSITPHEDSIEHIVKQRNAGFGKSKDGRTLVYRVEHSLWEIYPLISFNFNLNYGKLFGSYWEFLNYEEPLNVMLAKGSQVKVYEWEYFEPSNKK